MYLKLLVIAENILTYCNLFLDFLDPEDAGSKRI
jgi:hypothetical protein